MKFTFHGNISFGNKNFLNLMKGLSNCNKLTCIEMNLINCGLSSKIEEEFILPKNTRFIKLNFRENGSFLFDNIEIFSKALN